MWQFSLSSVQRQYAALPLRPSRRVMLKIRRDWIFFMWAANNIFAWTERRERGKRQALVAHIASQHKKAGAKEEDALLLSLSEDQIRAAVRVGFCEWLRCRTWEWMTGREQFPTLPEDIDYSPPPTHDAETKVQHTTLSNPRVEKLRQWYEEARREWPRMIPEPNFKWEQVDHWGLEVGLLEAKWDLIGNVNSGTAPFRSFQPILVQSPKRALELFLIGVGTYCIVYIFIWLILSSCGFYRE
ncbi:hypothetical protein BLS_002608 [Venturia inaequalis]|uniref:Uncharacterized protein n=1 Tax=Venturia inaequalis TaxID=5025 RepID=A0A8H3UTW7_VENIN|nr:hypothetical protein BLS_002608 [Venturia inaequalis]RDI90012.1 hypothetical protein Vi05172_g66 [Venturia inaequalis]